MRGCVWSFRALSPDLLPRLLSHSRCCRTRAICHGMWSSVRFFSTAPEAQVAPLPSQARVVICGGGIVGTSVAYHLAKLGWTEVVLLEQGRWMLCNKYSCTRVFVPLQEWFQVHNAFGGEFLLVIVTLFKKKKKKLSIDLTVINSSIHPSIHHFLLFLLPFIIVCFSFSLMFFHFPTYFFAFFIFPSFLPFPLRWKCCKFQIHVY